MSSYHHRFYRCSCYFTDNIFLKRLGLREHVFLDTSQQFKLDYQRLAWLNGLLVEDLLKEAETEVQRRRNFVDGEADRKKSAQIHYIRSCPEIFQFTAQWIDADFLDLFYSLKKSNMTDFARYRICSSDLADVYFIPVFSSQFCRKLLIELDSFEKSGIFKARPNTMNSYGVWVVLDELGLGEFFDEFRIKFLDPLARVLFPLFVGKKTGLDSHRAFTVSYSMDTETELSWHFDNSEVTLNVGLCDSSTDFSGGELVFIDGTEPESQFCSLPLSHKGLSLNYVTPAVKFSGHM